MFRTCSNLTLRNQNGINKVVLVSFLPTWDMLTRVPTISTGGNDHQANTIAKGIDPVNSLFNQKNGSKHLVRWRGKESTWERIIVQISSKDFRLRNFLLQIFRFSFLENITQLVYASFFIFQICMKFVVSNHLSSDEFMHVISKRFCPKMKEGSNKEGCTSCVRDILFIYDV